MKISYLMESFGNTGGSIVLYNFMDNLVKRGHEVYAIFPDGHIKWEAGIWKEKIINSTSTKMKIFSFFNYKNVLFNLLKNSTISTLLKKINLITDPGFNEKNVEGLIKNWVKSHITFSTFCFTAYAGYFLSDKTVSLYHMQSFDELFFQNKRDRLIARGSYYLPLIKISNSKWLQNIISKEFGYESYLLNPGINLDIFKPYNDFKSKYREKKEWTIVSYLDESRESKGFNDSVKAIKLVREHLKSQNIKIRWKVFGYSEPLNKYGTEFDYVGKKFGEDLAKLYSESDIILLTSWFESFPLPPIEAMACGSLIISTRYGTEDYIFDSKNGLVCLPRDINNISKKIIYAVENPDECLKMVKNGLLTASKYNWEERTTKLEQILEESIKNYSFDNNLSLISNVSKGKFDEKIYELFNIDNKRE